MVFSEIAPSEFDTDQEEEITLALVCVLETMLDITFEISSEWEVCKSFV